MKNKKNRFIIIIFSLIFSSTAFSITQFKKSNLFGTWRFTTVSMGSKKNIQVKKMATFLVIKKSGDLIVKMNKQTKKGKWKYSQNKLSFIMRNREEKNKIIELTKNKLIILANNARIKVEFQKVPFEIDKKLIYGYWQNVIIPRNPMRKTNVRENEIFIHFSDQNILFKQKKPVFRFEIKNKQLILTPHKGSDFKKIKLSIVSLTKDELGLNNQKTKLIERLLRVSKKIYLSLSKDKLLGTWQVYDIYIEGRRMPIKNGMILKFNENFTYQLDDEKGTWERSRKNLVLSSSENEKQNFYIQRIENFKLIIYNPNSREKLILKRIQ